jgi:hypothetical protein
VLALHSVVGYVDGTMTVNGPMEVTSDLLIGDGDQLMAIKNTTTDMMGDIKLVEEAVQRGRGIDTGPCHRGTRRISGGDVKPIQKSRVVMVSQPTRS